MTTDNSPLKIGLFYDGNFLLHASNYYNYVHLHRRRISLNGLHKFVRQRVAELEHKDITCCSIVENHYFRGRINAAEAAQHGNQLYFDRVFDDILMSEGIETHYLPVRNVGGRKEEHGIDVWLALEAYELSVLRKLDLVVLVVADTDYVPLLRKLAGLGVKIMLLSWEFEYFNNEGVKVTTKTSHELIQLANYPILMHEEIDNGLNNDDELIKNMFIATESRQVADNEDKIFDTGEVLSIKNGYGFIKFPNNNLFFHYQDVDGEFSEIIAGDTVTFTVDKNANNQDVAKNVKKL